MQPLIYKQTLLRNIFMFVSYKIKTKVNVFTKFYISKKCNIEKPKRKESFKTNHIFIYVCTAHPKQNKNKKTD